MSKRYNERALLIATAEVLLECVRNGSMFVSINSKEYLLESYVAVHGKDEWTDAFFKHLDEKLAEREMWRQQAKIGEEK